MAPHLADHDPYHPEIEINGHLYWPAPYSVKPLPPVLSRGLIAVGFFAFLSFAATFILICFICMRLFNWKNHYRTFIGYNQYVILVLNLLIADMNQAAGFMLSLHWLRKDEILSPDPACYAQGWLIHSGDVGSGLFVLAIAIHTFYTACYGKRISNKAFGSCIICIWIFAYFLTGVGLGLHGDKYFTRAGAWCWISEHYETDRLLCHYLWIFMVEFGTILLYIVTFFKLRKKTRAVFNGHSAGPNAANASTISAVNRITTLMTLYPCVYVLLTLPLSAGRMWSMAHGGAGTSNTFACIAGAMISSCGLADSLLYTLTRQRLLKDTMPGNDSSARQPSKGWASSDMASKGITHTRTVTVENGHVLDALYDTSGVSITGSAGGRGHGHVFEAPSFERVPSPTGSTDRILNGAGRPMKGGRTKTEISAGLREILDDEDDERRSESLPSYVAQPK